jgi:DNA-binding PadR family transcriptional regulator
LLGMAPASGYDVKKIFESTPMGHFSSSPGAIYPALKRLASRGLVEARLDTTVQARPRRVFSLTQAGEETLREWLGQSVTRQELVHDADVPILRFSLAEGKLSRPEVVAYLQGFEREVSSYLEELNEHLQRFAGVPQLHPRLSLENGIRRYESLRDWAQHATTEIEASESYSRSES